VLAALSAGHKLGLGLSGLAFVVFALVTAMVVPRWDPDFPGRRKSLYIAVCVLFFIGMLAAVFVFGKEEHEPEQRDAAALALGLFL
jgi:MFS family permease